MDRLGSSVRLSDASGCHHRRHWTPPHPHTTPNVTDPTLTPSEPILRYFDYTHLPPRLQEISKPFFLLTEHIMSQPRNPERTVALRKLLESKDACVRAAL